MIEWYACCEEGLLYHILYKLKFTTLKCINVNVQMPEDQNTAGIAVIW